MTEITEAVNAGTVAERARGIAFWPTIGRLLTTVLLWIPAAIGFVAGSGWFALVFTWLYAGAALKYGFLKGSRAKTRQVTGVA